MLNSALSLWIHTLQVRPKGRYRSNNLHHMLTRYVKTRVLSRSNQLCFKPYISLFLQGYLCRFGSEPIIRFWNLWRDLTRKLQDLAYTTFNATLWCTLHGRDRFWTYSGACSSDWGGNYQVFQVSRIGVPSIVGGQSIEELCFKMITQGCEYCDFHSWLFDWYGMMWSVRATIWFLMRQIR